MRWQCQHYVGKNQLTCGLNVFAVFARMLSHAHHLNLDLIVLYPSFLGLYTDPCLQQLTLDLIAAKAWSLENMLNVIPFVYY